MIVLLALQEKQVAITDQFNPTPITGRHAIFQKVSAPTEIRLDVEIVGVYSTLEVAAEARKHHQAAHPGRRYLQKVAQLDDNLPGPPEPSRCIKCGIETTGGVVFCVRCQKAHYDECNGLDPRHGEGDLVPVIRTPYGAQSTLLNQGM